MLGIRPGAAWVFAYGERWPVRMVSLAVFRWDFLASRVRYEWALEAARVDKLWRTYGSDRAE